MWTPLSECREEGTTEEALVVPDPAEQGLTELPPGLTPGDWLILGKVFERKKVTTIAKELGCGTGAVNAVLAKPAFKAAVEMVERSMMERIARGEFGVLAIAKANAVGAIRRLVGIAKLSEDDRVKMAANVKLLELAGIQPAKPMVVESPERLIDAMTAEEAQAFAESGDFPDRFRDQMARLATSVLEKNEELRWRPQVEVLSPLAGTDIADEPEREKPREVMEEEQ